jgi:hypothetical protein
LEWLGALCDGGTDRSAADCIPAARLVIPHIARHMVSSLKMPAIDETVAEVV